MDRPIETLEEFLAHAIAIEHEATERYREFEVHFGRRGDEILAGLCHNLAALEGEHLERLIEASRSLDLPVVSHRDYRRLEGASVHAPPRDVLLAVATPRALLTVALRGEVEALRFFEWAARTSAVAGVRSLAGEMAREESLHVLWLEQALGYSPQPIV